MNDTVDNLSGTAGTCLETVLAQRCGSRNSFFRRCKVNPHTALPLPVAHTSRNHVMKTLEAIQMLLKLGDNLFITPFWQKVLAEECRPNHLVSVNFDPIVANLKYARRADVFVFLLRLVGNDALRRYHLLENLLSCSKKGE